MQNDTLFVIIIIVVSYSFDDLEQVQENLYQKLFFFAEHGENMLCTKIVLSVRNNFCTQHVLPRFELGIFMY